MAKLAHRSALASKAEPLGLVGWSADGLRLLEKPFTRLYSLRGSAADNQFLGAAAEGLGGELPLEPCTSSRTARCSVLWTRLGGWLIVGDAEALDRALEGCHHALTDVSHRFAVLELSGPRARDILAQGCPLDLHPRIFPAGRVAGTMLAGQQVLLHCTGAMPGYDLYVDQSFGNYLWDWIKDAAS